MAMLSTLAAVALWGGIFALIRYYKRKKLPGRTVVVVGCPHGEEWDRCPTCRHL